MKIVLATHNAHKVTELQGILKRGLGNHELIGYDGPEPVEDGDTFEANALIKARAAFAHTGLPALADDSGICVDALGGAPGIHSARYAGTRDDADNVDLVLRNLAEQHATSIPQRVAQFVCVAAFVWDGGEAVERGVWPGRILDSRVGVAGFGYDPIFKPDDAAVSAAELTADQKNALSHRTQAFGAILPAVRAALG
ncbi:MAG TPA: RdgB/HAM1 family non-canonical purine NTP pyrophosphatase [Pseudolysinimonas sp.]|nr:RdgB/HAM1 family non-canonical purine NTP pyrophosphatase [Pseudolysinimonas sp.]